MMRRFQTSREKSHRQRVLAVMIGAVSAAALLVLVGPASADPGGRGMGPGMGPGRAGMSSADLGAGQGGQVRPEAVLRLIHQALEPMRPGHRGPMGHHGWKHHGGRGMGPGMKGGRGMGPFGQCAKPQVTFADVCGHKIPASVHAEWKDCQGPGGRGSSSGSIDMTNTVTAPKDCKGAFQFERTAKVDVTHTGRRGTFTDKSTRSVTGTRDHEAGTSSSTSTVDLDRSFQATGGAARGVHLTGTLNTTGTRAQGARTHAVSGNLTAAFADGNSVQLGIDGLTQSRRQCRAPTSGTVTVQTSSGNHTLVFGPDCGSVTVDGTQTKLEMHHRGGHGRWMHHGFGRGGRGMGPGMGRGGPPPANE